jgi:hypothetical protein
MRDTYAIRSSASTGGLKAQENLGGKVTECSET